MARALRLERPGGWYHLTARGNERKAIYLDETDRRHFYEMGQAVGGIATAAWRRRCIGSSGRAESNQALAERIRQARARL